MYKIAFIYFCVISVRALGWENFIEMDCDDEPFETYYGSSWQLTSYDTIILVGCIAPPNRTYVEVLRQKSIVIGDELQLLDLPSDLSFGREALADLPDNVELLRLESKGGVLHLKPGALSSLTKLKGLILYQVVAELPVNLDYLQLYYTGLRFIPKDALNVKTLTVVSDARIEIEGVMPRLIELVVDAPVPRLLGDLKAPNLELIEFRRNFPELREKIYSVPQTFKSMTRFVLSGVDWGALPDNLLYGGGNIQYFKAEFNNFVTVPEIFFRHASNLVSIDLNSNVLEVLPSKVFSGLNKLRSLRLSFNLLEVSDLNAVHNVISLKELWLDGNSLTDLCCYGNDSCTGVSVLSKLKNLELLDLSRNNLTYICDDWLKMTNLDWIYLQHNSITTIPCSVLRVRRPSRRFVPFIDLTDNSINAVTCTEQNYRRAVDKEPEQQVLILIKEQLVCSCDIYWLLLMVEEKKITAVDYQPRFGPRIKCTNSILKKTCPNIPK